MKITLSLDHGVTGLATVRVERYGIPRLLRPGGRLLVVVAAALGALLYLAAANCAGAAGLGWVQESVAGEPGNFLTVAFEGGIFLASSDISGRCYRSTDGVQWTAMNVPAGGSIRAFAYGNGRWVGVGDSGRVIDSTNGRDWQARRLTTRVLRDLAFGGGRFFIVGSNYRASSVDGVTWEERESIGNRWNGVARSEARFVAVGSSAGFALSNGSIGDWTDLYLFHVDLSEPDFHAICRGPDRFIAVGEGGAIVTSGDGLRWDVRRTDTQGFDLLSVDHGADLYVAAGAAGTILASSDGQTWTPEVSGTTAWLRGVAYGNGRYLVVGDGGILLRSRDLAPGILRFSTSAVSVSEDAGKVRLSVIREGGGFGAAELNYAALSGTAEAGTDFQPIQGRLGWADGEQGEKVIEISLVDDSAEEGAEEFQVVLSLAAGASLGSPSSATVAIAGPNDTPLTEGLPPSIVGQPVSLRTGLDGTARFEARASGTSPMRFQWLKNGGPLKDETNAVLQIAPVRLADGGRYEVVVSNMEGAMVSAPAVLEIALDPIEMTDLFANRQVFTESAKVGNTNNVAATNDGPSEPLHAGKRGGRSVWMAWRAPFAGRATFSTVGSTFDTLLGVYTGIGLGVLTEVVADDDSGGALTSRVQFQAGPGVDYQVAVDGFAGATGPIVLSWSLEAGLPELPRIREFPRSITLEKDSDTTLTVQAEGPGLSYQWRTNGVAIAGATSPSLVITAASPGQAGVYSVRVSRADDPAVFVDTPGALVEVTSRPIAAVSQDKLEDLFPPPNGFGPSLHAGGGSFGAISMSAGSILLVDSDLQLAQRSPGDPVVQGEVGVASLWWRMTVTDEGYLGLSTAGSGIDALLGVYVDRQALNVVADAVGKGADKPAQVLFYASPGVDYLVMLDGLNRARGRIRLTASRPLAVVDPLKFKGKLDRGAFVLWGPVPPGRLELRSGEGVLGLVSLLKTNVRGGMFEFIDPRPPAVGARFFEIRPLGRGSP